MMTGRDLSAELFGSNGARDLTAELFGDSQPTQAKPLTRTERVMKGIRDPIDAGAQLLTNMLPSSIVNAGNRLNNMLADSTGLVARLPDGGVDAQVRQAEREYQARRAAGGESGIDAYRALGNAVSPANLAVASRLPAAVSLAGRIGAGALGGAASGALTPVSDGDFTTEKLKQAGMGAAVGGVLPAAVGGVARVISPNASKNANLQMLQQEGVRPTIGQALGGRWNAAEEKLQSLPIMGDSIALARGRSLSDFNKAAINRAAGKVGAQVDEIGQEGVKQAGDVISKSYDDALGQISGVRLDGAFNRDLMQLRGMAHGLTDTMKTKFNNAINQTLMRKVSRNGSILPDDYKAIDSELGQLASRYGKSQVASEQELGDAVTQLQSLLKQQMLRSNPDVAQRLAQADEAWANLVLVEGAAGAAKNAEGVFTPAQLNAAIRSGDNSVRKRAVARGTALMQDLGNAGQQVLGNKVPNSFTTDRALIAGGGLGAGLLNPAIPAGLLGGAAAYTPQVQRALVAAATNRPAAAEPIADYLRLISPFALGGAGQVGMGLLNQ